MVTKFTAINKGGNLWIHYQASTGQKSRAYLEGFDRIIFKGILKPLCYTAGMQIFLYRNKILNKDYKAWISSKSAAIIADAEEYTKQQCATDIQYLASCHIRKEAIACDRQEKSGTQKGLIGTWSCEYVTG